MKKFNFFIFLYDFRAATVQAAYNAGRRNFRFAWLAEANFRCANLQNADLPNANLQDANLQNANIQDANLQNADLQNANLQNANLQNASLKNAILLRADLHRANLQDANLQNADLSNANISGTCLDPSNRPNADAAAFQRTIFGLCIGYRTKNQPYIGGPDYEINRTYTAPWFSTSDTCCHPGLYVCPKPVAVADGITVLFRAEDCHHAEDKWRVKQFRVVS